MKHKLTRRLVLYFASVVLAFSVFLSIVFIILFSSNTERVYRDDLQHRAVTIANTLSEIMTGDHGTGREHGSGKGYGAYLRFLDDIAMSDVWIVDRNAQTISVGNGKNAVVYKELPEDVTKEIGYVFEDEVIYSEDFSNIFTDPTITVGAPIYGLDGTILAAVLLHTKASGFATANLSSVGILAISLLIALLLAVIMSVLLSKRFILPLTKMAQTTTQLSGGDYSARSYIRQDDEIGALSTHIDMLAQQLDIASTENRRLEQERKDFISQVSHELRTPVTVLRGSAEAFIDGVVSDKEELKQLGEQMLDESRQLERMINDLLELSRLQNPKYEIDKEDIYLPDVLGDTIRSANVIAKQKGINIQLENEQSLAPMIHGDYSRLRQMFMAVIDNAIKFSPKNSSILILLEATQGAGYTVSIKDNGTGIPEDILGSMFDRFSYSGGGNKSGTGLGLAIAKEIADRHGIAIEAKNHGNGALFVFSI